ncbi:cytochrome aa3 quinol oxidase subunit IV [Calidifontibacillus erzurumensis]|uniref:Quinol oxidase subunit 4 n=1 Tax=Calidifontibacillus erzurumensis TaxID=2741433 RepID=A0A8J8KEU0_9BACI|nr:cytochrome aa3 quinol oxidase subunit IV [Calidifontibacillus erzurumensis]NSL52165.1 cytochrome aa3 quinol oxidase subunit IV [Calidifontibacillus erzurumensis]
MLKQLFPFNQTIGYLFSLVLTLVALAVYYFDLSFAVSMTILLTTAFLQAGLQLVVFMHSGETKDKGAIYTNIFYSLVIGLATIFGTLLCMIWGII